MSKEDHPIAESINQIILSQSGFRVPVFPGVRWIILRGGTWNILLGQLIMEMTGIAVGNI